VICHSFVCSSFDFSGLLEKGHRGAAKVANTVAAEISLNVIFLSEPSAINGSEDTGEEEAGGPVQEATRPVDVVLFLVDAGHVGPELDAGQGETEWNTSLAEAVGPLRVRTACCFYSWTQTKL